MDESCNIWMSHVTCEWVMSLMSESYRLLESVMFHVWMSEVTYERVMSHMNEAYQIIEWVTWHTNESCHRRMSHVKYERIMSHVYMSHVTHMNEATDNRSSFISRQIIYSSQINTSSDTYATDGFIISTDKYITWHISMKQQINRSSSISRQIIYLPQINTSSDTYATDR